MCLRRPCCAVLNLWWRALLRSKAYVSSDANMDFLRDTVAHAPDLAPDAEGAEPAPKPKRARCARALRHASFQAPAPCASVEPGTCPHAVEPGPGVSASFMAYHFLVFSTHTTVDR